MSSFEGTVLKKEKECCFSFGVAEMWDQKTCKFKKRVQCKLLKYSTDNPPQIFVALRLKCTGSEILPTLQN